MLKGLYIISQIRKSKKFPIEQFYRPHIEGPKIALRETVSDTVFVLASSLKQKDLYFQAALHEAMDSFIAVLRGCGYHQKIRKFNLQIHPTPPKQKHPLYANWKLIKKITSSLIRFLNSTFSLFPHSPTR